jgi:hypothetical protein
MNGYRATIVVSESGIEPVLQPLLKGHDCLQRVDNRLRRIMASIVVFVGFP